MFFFTDERSPSQPLLTNLSGGPESVAHQRTAALHRGQHLCIPLDELKPLSHKKKSNIFSFTDGKHLQWCAAEMGQSLFLGVKWRFSRGRASK